MADDPILAGDGRTLRLERFPPRRDDPLRAWDAADAYVLADFGAAAPTGETLLVHDGFGTLACALHDRAPLAWSDSFLAREAARHNHLANGLAWDPARFVPMDRDPDGRFGLALVKIPKAMATFEDTLLRLRPLLAADARVVAAGMIKHVPMRAWRLLEEVVGPTRTSRGWRKARYAVAGFDPARERPARLAPAVWTWGEPPLTLTNGATVFSREGPDHGTRLLLAHLPHRDDPLRAADLGCGNGILALALARACPRAAILAVDESFQAVRDARANAAAAGCADRITCEAGDGLAATAPGSLDLVVCNPPFHHDHAVGDHLAWRMMTQARRALAPGGELLMVGNRHLGYHAKLGRLFGNCRPVAADRRFVVLSAVRDS
jgi:16S rRNA (guanine1207-N2)-methyltransferase